MAGTTNNENTLNAWEQNTERTFAVQGEKDSRILTLHIVENAAVKNELGDTEIRSKPVDLTGCAVRLYIKKPDSTVTFTDGTVTDETSGTCQFVLTEQSTAAAGEAVCTVLITSPDGTALKPVGLTIDIDANDLETTVVSSNEYMALVAALNSISDALNEAQQAAENAQQAVTDANSAISDISTKNDEITTAETARVTAEASRVTAEQGRADAESERQSNEAARQEAEEKRESDTAAAISNTNTAAQAANAAADNANHVPQYGDSGNWQSWDGAEYKDTGKPWKGEKGDTGDPLTVGGQYATLADLQAAYPTGDVKAYLVGNVLHVWAGSEWVPTEIKTPDLDEYAKKTDIPTTAADVHATPDTHIADSVSTETGVHGLRWFDSKLQAHKPDGTWEDISIGGGGGGGYPTADVTGLAATAGNAQVTIVWSDPPDGVVEGIVLAKWAGSKLVRKEGAYPTEPTDGVLLVDNKARDQYKVDGYVDTGLTNGTTYYYAVFPYTDQGIVNTNETNRVSAMPQASIAYGVRHHKNEPSPVLERLGDSVGFTFQAKSAAQEYHSDFDDKPIYRDIRVCNVVDGQVVAYEGEPGFTRDGTNGDVMVEIPKFYYKIEDTDDYRDFWISDAPREGYLVAPRHEPCDDYPDGLDKIYVGAYEASADYKSISGVAPLAKQTRAEFRAGFAGRGANYSMVDWATQFEIEILFMIEVANLDSQGTVGNGWTAPSNSTFIHTGGADNLGAITGSTGANNAVVWRGIENLWGNFHEWRDGINSYNSTLRVCRNPSEYAEYTTKNYVKVSYSNADIITGYTSARGFDDVYPWAQFPTAASGSASTCFCDYCRCDPREWRVAFVGGGWSDGTIAGLFFLQLFNAPADSYINVGSRLLILKP